MKMDVIPGKTNQFQVIPTEIGTFEGKCAELCGVYHSRMLFKVKVVLAEEYDAHMADLRAAGQIGAARQRPRPASRRERPTAGRPDASAGST